VVEGGTDAGARAGAGTKVVADVAATTTTATAVAAQAGVDYFVFTPTARHLSQSNIVDATCLQGTGRGGRVTKGDVIVAQDNAATPWEERCRYKRCCGIDLGTVNYTDVPYNMMRKIIAKYLTDSKSNVPHFYASIEIEINEILALCKRFLSWHDVGVSGNNIILKASALALRDVPEVNISLTSPSYTSRVLVPPQSILV